MILKVLLWINLSLLYLHEMDAVHTREWRMMIIMNRMGNTTGHRIFTALHFFMFIAVFYLIDFHFNYLFWFINIFLILHFFLHIIFLRHSENRMGNIFSSAIIASMALISFASIVTALTV